MKIGFIGDICWWQIALEMCVKHTLTSQNLLLCKVCIGNYISDDKVTLFGKEDSTISLWWGFTFLAQYWQSKLKWRQGRTIRKIPTWCNNWLVSNKVVGGDGRCDFLMVTHSFNQNLLDAMWANAQNKTSNQCNVTTFLAMVLRTHMKCTYCSLHFCQENRT